MCVGLYPGTLILLYQVCVLKAYVGLFWCGGVSYDTYFMCVGFFMLSVAEVAHVVVYVSSPSFFRLLTITSGVLVLSEF